MDQRDTRLIVDDAEVNRVILGELFSHDYKVLEAENGIQALEIIHACTNRIAVILMDIVMPQKDGFQVLQELGAEGLLANLPVVVITSENSSESEVRSFDLGASDIILKPFENYVVKRRVQNVIDLFRHKNHLEDLVLEQSHKLQESNEIMIDALSSVIEHRSLESGLHIRRIRMFTKILLQEVVSSHPEYCLDEQTIDIIASASSMHDIGKIAIPDSILNKPGKLTDAEYEIMKTHSVKGCEILKSLGRMNNKQYLRYAYNICRYHHERWDGRGYPDNLRGDNIPLCAQVVSIADVYDALTTDRVYKKAFSHDKAVSMILNGECGALNPKLLGCFQAVQDRFCALSKEYADAGDLLQELFPSAPVESGPESAPENAPLGQYKYFTLLKYLDSTVLEINLDNGRHSMAYTPVADFDRLRGNDSFDRDFSLFVENAVHPEDRQRIIDEVQDGIQGIYYEGKSRLVLECRIKWGTSSLYRWYRLSLLRVDTQNPRQRHALLIFSDIDNSKQAGLYQDQDDRRLLSALRRSYFSICLSNLTNNTCTVVSSPELKDSASSANYDQVVEAEVLNEIHPDDRELFLQHYSREEMLSYFSMHLDRVLEYRRKGPGGSYIWIEAMDVRSSDSESSELIVTSFLQDITARKEKGILSFSHASADREHLLQEFHFVFFEYDPHTGLMSFSPNYQERYGTVPPATLAELRRQSGDMIHPDDFDNYLNNLDRMEQGEDSLELEYRCRNAGGEYAWYKKNLVIYRDENGAPNRVCGMITDIDQYKRENELWEAKSQTDPLTGLLNKNTAEDQIASILKKSGDAAMHALFIVDLDNFKLTNDNYGHLMGDQLLKQITLKLTQQFRSGDLIGRIGGDEFIILMKNIGSLENVERKASSLCHAVSEISIGTSQQYRFSASVGVSLYPHDGTTYPDLFHKADLALYTSKHAGKGQWNFYSNSWTPTSAHQFQRMNRIEGLLETGNQFNSQLVSVFCETDNETDAIHALLDMTARHYSLNHVFVSQTNEDQTEHRLFDWCADTAAQPYKRVPAMSKEEVAAFQGYSDRDIVFRCSDAYTAPPIISRRLRKLGYSALLMVPILDDSGKVCGNVGFSEKDRPREWRASEEETCRFLSRLLAVTYMRKLSIQRLESMNQISSLLFDKVEAKGYVIDDPFQILRGNECLSSSISLQRGEKCYMVLQNRNSPCSNCPVRSLDKSCQYASRKMFISAWRKDYLVSASSMSWIDNRKAYLITCNDPPCNEGNDKGRS